jgi:dTDP-4-amino-4,6-dideoxygalactose transaminase
MDEIPQANPKAAYEAHRQEIEAALQRVLASGWYILGQEVAAFEQEFAAYLGVRFGVGVASGTDALELALRALQIGPGDLVFTVSQTAVATVAAVQRAGATPVLVDIEERTCTLDPQHLEDTLRASGRGRPLKGRPRAVIPVHLYGHPCDLAAIRELAARYQLKIIEDCAQAAGAECGGRKVGTWGELAAFSFYPTKNLGALGDGGLVATADPGLQERLAALRQYGWQERYVSAFPGVNSRLDALQAAVLRVKLPYLEQENQRRRLIARQYTQALTDSGITPPPEHGPVKHVFHLYVVRTTARDGLARRLREQGIATAVHYPLPVHLQPAYRAQVPLGPGGLPVTERVCREILSLPLYPQLTADQVGRVVAALRAG